MASLQSSDGGQISLFGERVMDLLEASLTKNLPDCVILASAEELSISADTLEVARLLGARVIVKGAVHTNNGRTALTVSVRDTVHSADLFTSTVDESSSNTLPDPSSVVNPALLAIVGHYGKSRPTLFEQVPGTGYAAYLAGKRLTRLRHSESSLRQALSSYREASSQKWVNGRLFSGLAETNVLLYEISRDPTWIQPSLAAIDAAIATPEATPQDQYRTANLLERVGNTTRSIVLFERLARKVPDSDGVQRAIARLCIKAGMLERATQAGRKAVALNPSSWSSQFTLGKVYIADSNFPAAIAAFRAAAALDRRSARTLNNLGAAYLYAGSPSLAVFSFRQAIALKPDAPAYNNLGAGLLQSGDPPGGLRAFQEALRLQPTSDIYAANVGLAFSYTGNRLESRRHFRLACQLAWTSPEIRTHFAAITGRIAYYTSQLGQMPRAVRLISSARDMNPNSMDLQYDDLVIRTMIGDLPRARVLAKGLLLRGYSVARITCNHQLHTLLDDSNFQELVSEYTHRGQRSEMPPCPLQAF